MATTIISKTLRLPPEVDASLKATAEREGRSENAVAVDAITRYTTGRERRRDELIDRVLIEDAGLLADLA